MNARKILNAAREGIGDPEEIRRALVECGELDGGVFEVDLRWAVVPIGRTPTVRTPCGNDGATPSGLPQIVPSEHLSYRLGGKL